MSRRWFVLVLLPLAALRAQEPPASRPECAALEQQFMDAQKEWNAAMRAASTAKNKDQLEALQKQRPESAFVPKFLAAAKACEGTDDAVPYLSWIVSRGDVKTAREAMTTLMDKHVAHPGVERAVARLGGLHGAFGLEQTRTWLDLVLARNTHESVQAQARFTRAGLYVGTRAAARSEELRRQAVADLKFVEEHGNTSIAEMAKSLRHEAECLEPGLIAPEIEAEDLDGVRFKLSDYRGKVVLLDFWGDW